MRKNSSASGCSAFMANHCAMAGDAPAGMTAAGMAGGFGSDATGSMARVMAIGALRSSGCAASTGRQTCGSVKWKGGHGQFVSNDHASPPALSVGASAMDTFEHRRLMLRSGLDLAALRGVEFGPLCSPTVSRAEGNILYVDHATADELRKKSHGDANVDLAAICDVDIVCDDGVLPGKLPDRSVDYVIASHVAEHIPDLATWLIDIESMLKPTGELRLVLPDKRFSFDYLRRVSSPAELLDCYLHKLRRPRIL